jgi:hypothetical protein
MIILWTVYARTDGPSSHGGRREGDQHFFPSLITQPGLVMLFSENHRHSSVDLGDELVGLTGYDCAGVQPQLRSRMAAAHGSALIPNIILKRRFPPTS